MQDTHWIHLYVNMTNSLHKLPEERGHPLQVYLLFITNCTRENHNIFADLGSKCNYSLQTPKVQHCAK